MNMSAQRVIQARVSAMEALIAMLLSKPDVDHKMIERLRAKRRRLGKAMVA